MSDKKTQKNATIGDYADYVFGGDTSVFGDWVFDERSEFVDALCEQRRQTTFDLDELDDSGDSERRRIVEELKASVERYRKTSIIVHPQFMEDLKKDPQLATMWYDENI
jgi:hypothetical protein